MTLTGRVENGAIVLDDPAELPEGARVEVRVVQTGRRPLHPEVLRFSGIISLEGDAREEYRQHLTEKYG